MDVKIVKDVEVFKDFSVQFGDYTQNFIWIPSGIFSVGTEKSEPLRGYRENRYQLQLSTGFWLAECAVSQKEWALVQGENPSVFQNNLMNPVDSVSWLDCIEGCAKLNSILKEKIPEPYFVSLPTQGQWEICCRAGTRTAYWCGNDKSSLFDVAWFNDNSNGKSHPVGTKKPNLWGFYDMHGGVAEWTMDGSNPNPLNKIVKDYVAEIEYLGDPTYDDIPGCHLVRGGYFGSTFEDGAMRSSDAVYFYSDDRRQGIGMRWCIRTPLPCDEDYR